MKSIEYVRGSRCTSDRCRIFSLLPLGFFNSGSGLGLDFANHPVTFSGDTGGSGQSFRKFWQSIYTAMLSVLPFQAQNYRNRT